MKMRIATFLPIGLFTMMGTILFVGLGHDPRIMPSTLIGRQVPVFDLPALDPTQRNLQSASMRERMTLLNVWGSWCGSCRDEHPLLMELSRDKRFKLVGLDWKDSTANAKQFLTTNGNPYSAIGIDESGRTAIDLGVSGAPETFVIDKTGAIRLRIPGPLTPEIWAKEIEPLLKTQSPAP